MSGNHYASCLPDFGNTFFNYSAPRWVATHIYKLTTQTSEVDFVAEGLQMAHEVRMNLRASSGPQGTLWGLGVLGLDIAEHLGMSL